MIWKKWKNLLRHNHKPSLVGLEILKYIGPGFLVTIGFIDPGNMATNVAAGSSHGYALLWVVTVSTVMLIILQHNAAHLGIVTGLCISEAAAIHLPAWLSTLTMASAMLAATSTVLAEVLGGAIALNMLFAIPLKLGALIIAGVVAWMLYGNSYKQLERWIIGFVSLIGLSFIFELTLVHVDWGRAAAGWFVPTIPSGSLLIIVSVMGAVVMPHNLFLHSEIIQSRNWNPEDGQAIKRQLKYEYMDTIFSMIVGWAINSAMILVASATFFEAGTRVNDLQQAHSMLHPLLGNGAAIVFALALLFAGISACVTAGMAGGSIFAGIFGEPYNISDRHSRVGVAIVLVTAVLLVFFIKDSFKSLLLSQMFLCVQLPITVALQIYLTASRKVMGRYANTRSTNVILIIIGAAVTALNLMLFVSYLK